MTEDELLINQLKIENNSLLLDLNGLKSLLKTNTDNIEKANKILELFKHVDILSGREGKEHLILKEIEEIKGKEFFDSKNYKKYSNTNIYNFDDEKLEIFIGTKLIANINDTNYYEFLKKTLHILDSILSFYVESAIVVNAAERIKNI